MKKLLLMIFMVGSCLGNDSNVSIEKDDLNFYLAYSQKNVNFCVVIANKDKKSTCFGIVKNDTGYCAMVNNMNLKNQCLAISLENIQYCNNLDTNESQAECLSLYKTIKEDDNSTISILSK